MQQQQHPQISNNTQFVGVTQDESGRPLYIIRDQGQKSRNRGIAAHKANIAVARALSSTLQTSLGPRGMDKILQSQDYELTITNDGATILDKMEVENHVAKLLVDLSKCQDNEIGDGTTGVVVIAGALLEQAETLLDKGIHPIRISEGYEQACDIAIKELEKIAILNQVSRDKLIKSAKTSLGSKIINRHHDHMSELAVDAVLTVKDARGDVDFDLIKIKTKIGGKLEETQLISGVVLDQDMSHQNMQKDFTNAKIAILTCPFEPPKPKTTYKIDIDSAEKYNELYRQEQSFFIDMVDRVKKSGAQVVFCQWGFDDEANSLLQQAGISAVRWAKGEDIEALAITTQARIVARFEDLSADKLGVAASIKVESLGTSSDKVLIVKGEKQSLCTLFIRGGNALILDEAERSLHDAMCVVRNLVRDPRVVCGGGAAEIYCSLKILEFLSQGTEQYAMRAFSEALESIPLNLARNSGLNPIQSLADARKLQKEQNSGVFGINCVVGSTGAGDMREQSVFESFNSKRQQLMLATQVVRMILKIDEVIDDNEGMQQ
ncbi:TCP-1 chaperonin subunit epsilon [Spironucleus salmonicida]|uniref:T-complex protein 1 subunit epsilon n=1 Tax=Spironucleus salmonicida TaxID=348837 RepID=V6LQG7_9EUKA|nr:TCP-1 chaperonin subunit epsilon [Spironucleus salmonicida]|eukprot:EST46493.1 TCP-1 chaperonin subunit epsilon [Spironucleus salmonicida]